MTASAFTAWTNKSGTIEGPLTFESDAATVTLLATDTAGNFVAFGIEMADVPRTLEYLAQAYRLAVVDAVAA